MATTQFYSFSNYSAMSDVNKLVFELQLIDRSAYDFNEAGFINLSGNPEAQSGEDLMLIFITSVATLLTVLIVQKRSEISQKFQSIITKLINDNPYTRFNRAAIAVERTCNVVASQSAHIGEAHGRIAESSDLISGPFKFLQQAVNSLGRDRVKMALCLLQLATFIYLASATDNALARTALLGSCIASTLALGYSLKDTILTPFLSFAAWLRLVFSGRPRAQDDSSIVHSAMGSMLKVFGSIFGYPVRESDINVKSVNAVRSCLLLGRDGFSTVKSVFKFVSESFVQYYYQATGKVLKLNFLDERISPALAWMEEVRSLIVLDNNPHLSVLREQSVGLRLIDLEQRGHAIAASLLRQNIKESNFKVFFDVQRDLSSFLRIAKTSIAISDGRRRPVAVAIVGKEVGVGKSTMVEFLFNDVVHVLNEMHGATLPNFSTNNTYYKNLASEYDEGYLNQPFVILDDFGQYNKDEDMGKAYNWVVAAVNDAPMSMNMAFEGKGVTFFNSSFVAITSNLDPLPKPKSLTSMPAVESRLDVYVTVNLKTEYKRSERGPGTGFNREVWLITDRTTNTVITYDQLVWKTVNAYLNHQGRKESLKDFLSKERAVKPYMPKAQNGTQEITPFDVGLGPWSEIFRTLGTSDILSVRRSCKTLNIFASKILGIGILPKAYLNFVQSRGFDLNSGNRFIYQPLRQFLNVRKESSRLFFLSKFGALMRFLGSSHIDFIRMACLKASLNVQLIETVTNYVSHTERGFGPRLITMDADSRIIVGSALDQIREMVTPTFDKGSFDRPNFEKFISEDGAPYTDVLALVYIHARSKPKLLKLAKKQWLFIFNLTRTLAAHADISGFLIPSNQVFHSPCLQLVQNYKLLVGAVVLAINNSDIDLMKVGMKGDYITAARILVNGFDNLDYYSTCSPGDRLFVVRHDYTAYIPSNVLFNESGPRLVPALKFMRSGESYRDLRRQNVFQQLLGNHAPGAFFGMDQNILKRRREMKARPLDLKVKRKCAFPRQDTYHVGTPGPKLFSPVLDYPVAQNGVTKLTEAVHSVIQEEFSSSLVEAAIDHFKHLESTNPFEVKASKLFLASFPHESQLKLGMEDDGDYSDFSLSSYLDYFRITIKSVHFSGFASTSEQKLGDFVKCGGYVTNEGKIVVPDLITNPEETRRLVQELIMSLSDLEQYKHLIVQGNRVNLVSEDNDLFNLVVCRARSDKFLTDDEEDALRRAEGVFGISRVKCVHNTGPCNVIDDITQVSNIDKKFFSKIGTAQFVTAFKTFLQLRRDVCTSSTGAIRRYPWLFKTRSEVTPLHSLSTVRKMFFQYAAEHLSIIDCGHLHHDQRLLYAWEAARPVVLRELLSIQMGFFAHVSEAYQSFFSNIQSVLFKMEDQVHSLMCYRVGQKRSVEQVIDDITGFKEVETHNPWSHLIEYGVVVAALMGSFKLASFLLKGSSKSLAQSTEPVHVQEPVLVEPAQGFKIVTIPTAQSTDSNAEDIVMNKIVPNFYSYSVSSPKQPRGYTSFMTFVSDYSAITTYHAISYVVCDAEASINIKVSPVDFVKVYLRDVNIKSIEGQDKCLLTFKNTSGLRQHKNIVSLFIKDDEKVASLRSGIVLLTRSKGSVVKMTSPVCKPCQMPYSDKNGKFWQNADTFKTDLHTEDGFCGAVYYVHNTQQQHKIVGMHISATSDSAFGCCITQELLLALLATAQSGIPESQEFPSVYCDGERSRVDMIHRLRVGRLKQQFQTWSPGNKQIVKSPIYGKIAESTVVPAYTRFLPDGTPAFSKVLEKMDVPKTRFSSEIRQGFEEIYDWICFNLPPKVPMRILTVDEAINGSHELCIERFNMQSAVGFKYNDEMAEVFSKTKGKLGYFELKDGKYVMLENMARLCFEIIGDILAGKEPTIVFQTLHKVELRPANKSYPRAIFGSPAFFTILCRIFYGTFFGNLVANHNTFPVKVGINAHSLEWDEMYKFMNRPQGWVQYNGDISNNDNEMPVDFMELCADLTNDYYSLYEDIGQKMIDFGFGYKIELNDDQIKMVRKKLTWLSYNHYRVYGDGAFFFDTANASGRLETTYCNSFAAFSSLVLFLMNKFSLELHEVLKFSRFAVFGDDSSMTLRPDVAASVSIRQISEFYRDFILMRYVDCGKESNPDLWPEHHEDHTCTFLARSFVADEFGNIHGALQKQSIYDSINFVKKKMGVDYALGLNLETASREAFHHGKDFYNNFVASVRKVIQEEGLGDRVTCKFYTYNSLMNSFLNGGRGLLEDGFPVNFAKAQSGIAALSETDLVINEVDELSAYINAVPCVQEIRPSQSSILGTLDPYPKINLSSILDRPVVTNITWLSTSPPGTKIITYNFPNVIMDMNSYLSHNVKRHKYFRAKVSIEIKPSSNMFSRGELLFIWRPRCTHVLDRPATSRGSFVLAQAFCYEHVIVSATDAKNVCLNIPYLSPEDYWNTDDQTLGAFASVEVYVLNQLHNTEATTSSISLSLVMRFVDPEVAAPYDSAVEAHAQSGLKKEARQASGGILSNGLSTAANIAPLLYHIPVAGPVLAASSPLFKALSRLAKDKGYDKPTVVETPQKMRTYIADNLSLGTGADLSEKLAFSPTNEVSNLPSIFGDQRDYSQFSNFKRLMGLIGKVTFNAGQFLPGAAIFSFPVTPTANFVESAGTSSTITAYNHCTHLSAFANMWHFWTGGLNIMLMISAPKTVSGKLRVIWTPANPLAVITHGVPNNISLTFDFSGLTYCKFSIPFLSNVSWNTVYPYDAYIFPGFQTRDTSQSVNGYIAVYLDNEISYIGDPAMSIVDINVFMAGASDLRFSQFRGLPLSYAFTSERNMLNAPTTIQMGVVAPTEAKAQSGCLREDFMEDFEPMTKTSTIQLKSGIVFGEEIDNFHTVLHRPNFYKMYQIETALDLMFTDQQWVHKTHVVKSDLIRHDLLQNMRSLGSGNAYYNYQQFMLRFFQFYRGSVRYKIKQLGDQSLNMYFSLAPVVPALSNNRVAGTYNYIDLAPDSVSVFLPRPVIMPQEIQNVGHYPGNVNTGLIVSKGDTLAEIEMPFSNNHPYIDTRLSNFPQDVLFEYQPVQFLYENEVDASATYSSLFSVGDDFSFGHPTCPDVLFLAYHNSAVPQVKDEPIVIGSGLTLKTNTPPAYSKVPRRP